MRVAARSIIRVCRRKDAISVLRRRRPRKRHICENVKHPRQKHVREVRDLAQPYGLEVEWPVLPPRPRKMVLPVDASVSPRCRFKECEVIHLSA